MTKRIVEVLVKVEVPDYLDVSDEQVVKAVDKMLDVGFEDAVDSLDDNDHHEEAKLIVELLFDDPVVVPTYEVEVEVRGGLVQDVIMPDNVKVTVHDYDTDNGEEFIESVWVN